MPIIKPQGLQGLKGLGSLSESEYNAFVDRNKDLIAAHAYDPVYINNLYSNKQFIDKFGIDQFKAISDINIRNEVFKDAIVDEEWNKLYSPINPDGTRDNNRGLGADFEKYSQMSTDAKLKLLESDYLTPSELKDRQAEATQNTLDYTHGTGDSSDLFTRALGSATSSFGGAGNNGFGYLGETQASEAVQELEKRRNQKVLDQIYNDDVDLTAKKLGSVVSQAYMDPSISGMSDDQVKEAFVNAITPSQTNAGVATYAAYYGNGSNVESEMEDFSIDDMREVLAKKAVYEQYMSPEMASTALNNDAKRYIKDHQGSTTRFGLWAKDVGISAMSYTADKVNGIYNIGLWAADKMLDTPVVWVDDTGNVVDPSTVVAGQEGQGALGQGADGKMHPVHQEQINRTTLHNMGKDFDGSDAEGGIFSLNPQYWTKAEQFGTLSKDEQKQYEKLGVSPYKVAYNPDEDTDLWYESFKMMSFGLADGASMLVPYGIGMAGKALSTASKVGRVGRAFGQFMDYTGKALTAQTKFGQVAQGLAGAGGIAYAYQRGAFNETLQQNLANAEQTVLDKSKNEIYEQYNTDEEYKAQIDANIDARAASMKADYMAQMLKDGNAKIADEEALDKMIHAKAQEAVLGELVQQKVAEKKGSQEYADLQQEAINSAGDAAITTFFPEAVKYGIVNTVGFRSWLYKNPASLQKKAGQVFKGIKEVTTAEGKQRLASEASKFATRGDKLKQFGKVLGTQAWGGAWTNGTDDMMVDAAERINEDSFNRYLNAYATGEPIADTYGFADGLYSYWKGINNSLGQETTWNAAAVGGLGSILSVTPNMTNIAHYMTKSGREDFQKRYKDATWRDKANYFIQNGVLNTYYGAKVNEWDQKNHIDYVNKILDDYDDFKVVEDLITSDIGLQNAETVGDQKTMEFVKAINAVDALNHLANSKNDPAAMSSVVNNMKSMIDRAAKMSFDPNEEGFFSEEEARNLVAQYYANNPGLAHSEYNSQKALYDIAQNAQELKEAAQAYEEAEKQVQSVERSRGQQIAPEVRAKMKMNQALNGHWLKRVDTMKDEIGDTSTSTEVSEDNLIPSLGGEKNAAALIKVYNKQQKELEKELEEQKAQTAKKQEALQKTQDDLKAATTSDERYAAQQVVNEAQAEVDDALQQEDYLKGLTQRTVDKREQVQKALDDLNTTDTEGNETIGKYLLTADEIFNLDPVTRARMMNPANRDIYGISQQREIEKLEQRLLMRDGDALQKIQDIALLTQRIETNQDTYSRMAKNPEAAAVQLEAQRQQSADAAHKLINQRNAETVVDIIGQFDEGMKGHDDVSQDQKNQFVFKTLRKLNPTLLNIINDDQLLPQYQQQVQDAKEWGEVTADIDAVIQNAEKDDAWKQNISQNVARVIEGATNKDGIMSNLERVIDDVQNPQVTQDFETVLSGLEKLGYQRDATVIEDRKQRKEREEANKNLKVDKAEASQIAANEAAAKAAADAEAWAEKANKNPKGVSLENVPLEEVPLEEEGVSDVQPYIDRMNKSNDHKEIDAIFSEGLKAGIPEKELFPTYSKRHADIDKNKKEEIETSIQKPSYHDSMKDQLDGKESSFDYYIKDAEYNTKSGHVAGGPAFQGTIQPAISYAIEAGLLSDTFEDVAKNKNVPYERAVTAVQELKKLGINSPSELTSFVEQHEGESINDIVPSQQKTEPSVINSMEEDADTVKGKSATIDEQMQDTSGQKEQHSSDETTDVAAVNGVGEHVIENSATTLSGNAMSEYQSDALQNNGVLKHKQGKESTDNMSKFYAWMDAAGIKLQNIIDLELGRIIARNPQAKVKFMAIRPESNATHDSDMKTHLMLVLDYDNSINKGITMIHNDANGGVIESAGKKYLVIGVAGYGKSPEKMALKDILFNNNPRSAVPYGLVKRGMGEFFRNNPNERFFVPDGLSTEVVPASLIPGYIVKQLETDDTAEYRTIQELLNDPERNPMNLDMESLAFGIQEITKFLVVGTSLDNVMVPRNTGRNAGSAFVLIPAANGKMVPAYLKPLMYNEMNDGKLKDRINNLLTELTAPQYATRYNALMALQNILYMDLENGDHILLGKDNSSRKNQISLVHDGNVFRTFVLDSNFDRQQFMEAIAEMNPRINITASVLQSPLLLQQYDEAGALQTDIARLGTAGSSYSIYGVDASGNMLKPEEVNNDIPKSPVGSDFRSNPNKVQVVYGGNYYLYDTQTGTYTINGELVKEPRVLSNLDYNRMVVEGSLSPVKTEGTWDTYILDVDEVIKIERNTKEVKMVPEAQAKAIIEKVAQQKAEEAREAAAEKELKETEKKMWEAYDNGEVSTTDVDLVVDPETGELVAPEQRAVPEEKREIEEEGKKEAPAEQQSHNQDDLTHKSVEELESSNATAATQTFETLISNRKYMMQILNVIKSKWADAPTKISDLKSFIKGKNMEVDAIGTSDADVQAWIKTLEDCR